MTNESLDTINLTSSGSTTSSTCSSSSSSSSSSASNCSPNSPPNHINSYLVMSSSGNASSSSSNAKSMLISPHLDEVTANFGMIMKDLKTVSSTLNLLARQIDQVVNKMDTKFNFIIENMNSQSCDSNENKNCNEADNKKIIKVINNSNAGKKCLGNARTSGASNNTPAVAAVSPLTTGPMASTTIAITSPNSAGNSLNKSTNALKKQAGSLLTSLVAASTSSSTSNEPYGRRALSDRKVVNFSDDNSILSPVSAASGLIDVKLYPSNPPNVIGKTSKMMNQQQHHTWNSNTINVNMSNTEDEENNRAVCSSNGRANLFSTNNANDLSKVKCTRSKSQPAFKDGSYSFITSSESL